MNLPLGQYDSSRARAKAFCYAVAVACVLMLPAVARAATTNLISSTTFQYPSGILKNNWDYSYATPSVPPGSVEVFDYQWYDQENDPEITNYLGRFYFDDSVFAPMVATNSSLSYGSGFGGSLQLTNDGAVFASPYRSNYLCSFEMRVEGLKPGQTSVSADFSLKFEADDNTLQPRDTNTDQDLLLQVNYYANVRSNWTRFVFLLSQATPGGGTSDGTFLLHHTNVNNLVFGVNFHQPGTGFGFDSNNVVWIDNIRVELRQN
jgi:hypothetical protein